MSSGSATTATIPQPSSQKKIVAACFAAAFSSMVLSQTHFGKLAPKKLPMALASIISLECK